MIILDSMGHLYSTESLKELYLFAKKMGLNLRWNHYSRHFPHFDLTTYNKKREAIRQGAKYVDARIDFHYVEQCRSWSRAMYDAEKVNNNLFYYEDYGLMKQRILRLDFNKLSHLLN